jgi:subtilisin family serine protease
MKNLNIIRITVVDFNNQPLSNAEVTVTAKRKKENLKYDKYLGAYILEEFRPDKYVISIVASGFGEQKKEVFISASGIEEIFILGKKGMPIYYRGNVKVPFNPISENFGVAISAPEGKKQIELLTRVSKEFNVSEVKTHDNYRKNGLFIFSYPENYNDGEKHKLLETFKKRLNTPVAGPILKQDEKNASILTDEIVVRFKGNIEEKQVKAISNKLGLTILRIIPYAGNAYQFKVTKGGIYKALDACNQLVEMGIVEYAEPNLFHTYEEDAIVPTNYLYPEQWDHPIINTPDAWQVLNDNLGVAQRFGNPDIIVAVVDSGVNVNHPQFNRNVSNGQPKVFTAFDFANMVANNNTLGGSHGSCCASASVGFTDVSSVAGGVPDGTVGIAGNCRLMAIRRSGTEADYADMYVWIGGFNPNSARAGFPAQLARGADIISNSFGYSINNPISGLMRDTFDHLTTYGRNGRGVLLFFSAGNDSVNLDITFRRPWGMYQKCMSVAAASLANDGITETRAVYSNFGTPISFCTHSHDQFPTTHNPSANYGAWTGTVLNGVSDDDGNAPRNRERQTTLTAAANAGLITVTVASTAGMVNGQAIMIGNPSANISPSETKRITNIVGNVITFTPALFANKANGTVVNFGNRDYRNNFGGTSYATPVIAGVAALMLSVNNRLTWIEVRDILRETAIKIDPNNTNANGRWRDPANRISTDPGYAGPFFSQFYGYGRISVVAAVTTAINYVHTRDMYIRDNMADTGAGTSSSPHWRGVDIWVRNNNDGVAPANYATDANAVHLPPIAGQSNWLNVRYRNRGTTNSYPFYLRAYLAHYPGTEFIYPDNFIPTVRPNGVIPNPLTPGTYLIGEQLVNSVAAGVDGFVTFEWQQQLIPPQTVAVGGINVNWHPCLLVEVSPHDGFVPTGNHVWDNNNLAQKNISIIYPDSSSDNASLVVLGNQLKGRLKNLKFVIFTEPRIKAPYFITFVDPKINELFVSKFSKTIKDAEVGNLKKAKGVWIHSQDKIFFEIPNVGLTAMIIALGKQKTFKEGFEINIVQYAGKRISGSCGITFRTKK